MKPLAITQQCFEGTIGKDGIVLLDFWADWCAPCRRFGPIFEAAAEKHGDITFGKVDTQSEQQLAASLGIRSIPTVMAFKDGVLVFEQAGLLPAPLLDTLVEKLRALDMNEVKAELERQQPSP